MPRILIAEDDDGVRSVLARHLGSAGYEVLETADGRACLDVLRTTPVDLVIIDIYMPEVDGIAVIAQAHREFAHVRILAISGGGTVPRERTLEIAQRRRRGRGCWRGRGAQGQGRAPLRSGRAGGRRVAGGGMPRTSLAPH